MCGGINDVVIGNKFH